MQFKGRIIRIANPSAQLPAGGASPNDSDDEPPNFSHKDGPVTKRSPFRVNNTTNEVPNISVEMLSASSDHMPDRIERIKIKETFFPPKKMQPTNEMESLFMNSSISYLHMMYVILAIKSGLNMQQIKAIADPELDIDIIKNMFPALKSGMSIYDAKRAEKSLSAQEVEKRMKNGETVLDIFESVPDHWKQTMMYEEAFNIYSHMEMDVTMRISDDPSLSLSDAIDLVHKEYLTHNFNGFDPFH
jgi:hypothetical protein